ncbi:hypothetical protein EDC96DRAFT_500346 [Choanephora cucurbitarum]|nr:hypothetical protein EDC96DRAFT_500346 [Choanephora cucurbitarum]
MEVQAELDRKRKADDESLEENSVKRPFIHNNEYDTTESFPKSEEATSESAAETQAVDDNSCPVKLEHKDEAEQIPQQPASSSTTKQEPATSTNIPFDRLIFFHLEATCDENPTNPAAVQVTKENSEVIEMSFVVVDGASLEVLHQQSIYVKPERTPLTPFCSEVTGIKWSMLEHAGSLNDAINQLDDYIQKEIEAEKKSFCFVTHGGWVLRIQLPREARDKNLTLPNYMAFCRMFDLKQEIQRWQVHHPEISLRSTSLRDLCEIFEIKRVTDQTVGLNATLTTLKIVRHLTRFRHSDVFVHPIDTNADLKQFKKEESKVIHLAGLPFEVTQGELEAWFSSNGLRPTTMWMIQPSDSSKPSISGFVVFQLHDDAMRALSLNGRCLGDRPIEVCPSSSRVIDAAGNMLVPFPLQAKSRQLRPGDWNCYNCSFHNFASRLYCFKCNTKNPNPGPQAGQGPPVQPFTRGDWMCPNPSCNFHNYASRMQCKKCGHMKPMGNKKPIKMGKMDSGQPPYHMSMHNMPAGATGAAGAGGPSGDVSNNGGGYHGGYSSRPHHHHISFRPGDWYCPNANCGFQNFASRNSCFRCHTPNPNLSQMSSSSTQSQIGSVPAPAPNGSSAAIASAQHSQYSPHQPGYGYSDSNANYQSNTGYVGNNGGVAGGNNNNSGGYGYGQPGGGYGGQNSSYAAPGGGYGGGGNGSGYAYGGGGYAYGGAHQNGPPGSTPGTTQFRAGDWIW